MQPIVDPALARDEDLKHRHPAEYDRRKHEAYGRGAGNSAPAVVTATTATACMAVDELLQVLVNFRGPERLGLADASTSCATGFLARYRTKAARSASMVRTGARRRGAVHWCADAGCRDGAVRRTNDEPIPKTHKVGVYPPSP